MLAIPASVQWPEGKRFAFTVFDDTDFATLENTRPVYDFLGECGFRTTKSVWPLAGRRRTSTEGSTCDDPKYLNWIFELRDAGFEIGHHMATYHTSQRADTIKALDIFEQLFNGPPATMANHVDCLETIYWGDSRLTGLNRQLYNIATRFGRRRISYGHVPGDPHFWGDACQARIKYVRNFVFPEINALKLCPFMPYHDPQRPFVNLWFASSEGAEVRSFTDCISEEAQDRLEAEGGACIMYTHFACGFYKDGRLDQRFADRMRRLGRKNGWFVPVRTLLDFLLASRDTHTLTDTERRTLERRWLISKLRTGTS
ncbi:MAG: hypothetical protein E5Y61_00950 [Mesorhizobium sp.]|nr:MAG: hypothetical protein E5Y61_00950 [Mesorhizobium sp.]TIM80322.1 MAG: hypothetical protein E5Y60_04430 [Mesorhizobium sp.]